MIKFIIKRLLLVFVISLLCIEVSFSAISQRPLFLAQDVAPLILLTMGRDHKLYYEAYNDASDLDGDGELDIKYKPASIDYYGYFDSYKCYKYDSGIFKPTAVSTNKKCSGSSEWSGDILNYLTTSRMDAIRKVLYGGYRSKDSTSETILERVYIPQDAHSWGKEYNSIAVDGYDIREYTPLSMPIFEKRHLFASTTLKTSGIPGVPILRLLRNQTIRIWDWVSKDEPVLEGAEGMIGRPEDLITKVKVCVSGMMLEDNCKAYSDGATVTYKPTGLLQKYGDDDTMAFGLLTGSFKNNLQGGVIRKNISSFTDEIDKNTGIFSSMNGIVKTIDKLRIYGFTGTHDGGWITNRPIKNGEANPWGNPVSEMMYEGLRYFAGKSGPTTEFAQNVSGPTSIDTKLGLPLPAWQDPYRTSGGYEYCAKPVQLVISDINPSYDTDAVPGSSFNTTFSGDLTALDVSKLADIIWAGESEASLIFIGESDGVDDGAPTPKQVTSFKNIRGLSPEEPTKLGGYYSGSVAYYGNQTDLNPVQNDQKVDLFSVVLASPLPRIEIPVNGQKVTIVPFAKSVYWGGGGISPNKGDFQPTDQIVDFYVVKIANTAPGNKDSSINSGRPYGEFIINFEDVEQGADHDMDAFVEYKFKVTAANEVVVELDMKSAAGGIIQHMGYIISGTTADGIYLEVRDEVYKWGDKDFFLDTPPGQLPGGKWDDKKELPQTTSRTFTPSTSASSGSYLKHDPLWYAAKWGGFKEESDVARRPADTAAPNNKPDQDYEWDSNKDGDPDNYFLVTNAGLLEKQLDKALVEILSRKNSSAAAVATNTARLNSTTKIYQARFDSENWTGEFLGFAIKSDGSIGAQAWNAADQIFINSTTSSNRKVFSFDRTDDNADGVKGMEFNWSELNPAQKTSLNHNGKAIPDAAGSEMGSDRLDYIRGDKSNEGSGISDFRIRASDLGDVINSDPWFVGKHEDFGYNILAAPEGSAYDAFRLSNQGTPAVPGRTPAVYFGANDGMLHAIDADSGEELFTYVPSEVIASLPKLSSPLYGCTGQGCIPHQYYVDGSVKSADTYFSSDSAWHTVLVGSLGAGGKAIFSLDVTEPKKAFDETKILWEISNTQAFDSTDLAEFQANLGYTLPQASIVRLNNGEWAAVVANGYDSVNKKAVLYLIDIETGQILKTLDTGIGSGTTPNGLSTPIVIDINGDKTADIVYAGDLLGNLWKFDLSDTNDAQWDVAYSNNNVLEPLYKACTNTSSPCTDIQPITAKPQVGRHSIDGLMVYFGTGKYFEEGDQIIGSPPQIQHFYGIRDNGDSVSGLDVLQEQEVLAESTLTFNVSNPATKFDIDVRVTSDCDTDYEGTATTDCDGAVINTPVAKEGWFMKLLSPVVNDGNGEGERVVSAPLLRDGRIIFVTMTPDPDACGDGGTSWLMEFDAESGARLDTSPFDVDGDGTFSESDYVKINDDDDDDDDDNDDNDNDPVPITGVRKRTWGIIKTPGVVVCEDGKECKYSSTTNGTIDMTLESTSTSYGRQSWNQIK